VIDTNVNPNPILNHNSKVTLTRIAILDAWTVIFYVNYYGCNYFQGDYYVSDELDTTNQSGMPYVCYTSRSDYNNNSGHSALHTPQPWPTVFFFISYIFIAAFCVLSLVVGCVTEGMFECMADIKAEEAHFTEEAIAQEMVKQGPKDRRTRTVLEYLKLSLNGHSPDYLEYKRLTLMKIIDEWRRVGM
jgi:hypothetical protein